MVGGTQERHEITPLISRSSLHEGSGKGYEVAGLRGATLSAHRHPRKPRFVKGGPFNWVPDF